MAGHAEEVALIEIGQVDVHLAAGAVLGWRLRAAARAAASTASATSAMAAPPLMPDARHITRGQVAVQHTRVTR